MLNLQRNNIQPINLEKPSVGDFISRHSMFRIASTISTPRLGWLQDFLQMAFAPQRLYSSGVKMDTEATQLQNGSKSHPQLRDHRAY
jgi:hypothetical protein